MSVGLLQWLLFAIAASHGITLHQWQDLFLALDKLVCMFPGSEGVVRCYALRITTSCHWHKVGSCCWHNVIKVNEPECVCLFLWESASLNKTSSDMPRDCCHGLNQSVTIIGGHDIMIRPAYSVVCRMRAITLSYAGNKQCLGPLTT